MVRRMTATELKARLLAVLDELAGGDEVEVTKLGHVVARLVPAAGGRSLMGRMAGVAMTAGDEEDLFATGVTWELR